MRRASLKAIALTFLISPSLAQGDNSKPFNAASYLAACSGFVSEGASLGVAGDAICVQSARQLCAAYGTSDVVCVTLAARWMSGEARKIWPTLSDEMRQGQAAPFDARRVHDLGMSLGSIGAKSDYVDCRKNHVVGIPTEVNCAYQDALAGWVAARTLQRLSREFPADLDKDR